MKILRMIAIFMFVPPLAKSRNGKRQCKAKKKEKKNPKFDFAVQGKRLRLLEFQQTMNFTFLSLFLLSLFLPFFFLSFFFILVLVGGRSGPVSHYLDLELTKTTISD